MRYPLFNYLALPRGYRFGDKTFYSDFHIGEDLTVGIGTPVYAPTDGRVSERPTGPNGGNTVHFLDSNGKLWRFLHLNTFVAGIGPVKEGDVLARSGNSGLSTGPHLHMDISLNGKLELSNRANFTDPEKYLKEHVMDTYDNHVIRHRTLGLFAYVKGGKKQEFNNSNGSIAIMTFLDRLPTGRFAQDFVVNVDGPVWDTIPNVKPNEVFFPSMK